MLAAKELIERAIKAHYQRTGAGAEQRQKTFSSIEVHGDKAYVVLRSMRGILAVYSVSGDDQIRYVTDHERPVSLGGRGKRIVPKGQRLPKRRGER